MSWSSAKIYFENRRPSNEPGIGLAVDVAAHLQHRQFLGSSIIICDNPLAIYSAVRKQWVKLTRRLLTKRASTLNPSETTRLSQLITRMSQMTCSVHRPEDEPNSQAYFLKPTELGEAPPGCFTLYICTRFSGDKVLEFIQQLPTHALAVI